MGVSKAKAVRMVSLSKLAFLHVAQVSGTKLEEKVPWGDATFGQALLAPTIIYVSRVLSLRKKVDVKVRIGTHPVSEATVG